MDSDPVAARYAHALFEAAKTDEQLETTLEQLTTLGALVHEEPKLRRLLLNPAIDPGEKVALLERVLHGAWSELVRAFVRMLVTADRVVLLPEVAESLQMAVDAERKTVRAIVRSSHPLPQTVLDRLQHVLEQRETQRVLLTSEVDPHLLGGFQLLLGNRVIDASVRQSLHDLREQLSGVRVA